MKKIKTICIVLLLFLSVVSVYGQDVHKIKGKVLSELNTPIAGAIVTISGGSIAENVTTKQDGTFEIEQKEGVNNVAVWASGYYTVNQLINGRSEIVVVMIPQSSYKYNETTVLPNRIEESKDKHTAATNINKKDFLLGNILIDQALTGQVAGLRMTRNGGMPGEGSYMNMRGLRSFVGANQPLIVINGVPYLPDSRESQLLNGFTRNIFQKYNINDIQNITVLKGADASIYGSMGSNGVILIETNGATSNDLETKISYYGQYGINWNNKRMPLLKGSDYKSYLSDVGMTYYKTMGDLFTNFPFLHDPNSKYNYLYNNNTDWQDEIYKSGFTTDNLFRVEGGDAIAKYDLSLGYSLENGLLKNTDLQRYHTQLSTNVLVSKQVEMVATVGLAYLTGAYQEQGMVKETNPILAAYSQAPILSPYKMDSKGNVLSTYAPYYYGISQNMDFATSNPVALVNTLDGRNRQYDVNIKAGITYKPLPELSFNGTVGLYYNYNKEHIFIPGRDDKSILPFFDKYGEASNTIKDGVGETTNLFYSGNVWYKKVYNQKHALNVLGGVQVIMSKYEYDAGLGRNTANDFYQTLSDSKGVGNRVIGYLDKWNWMNFYTHADYTYNGMVTASLNMSVDGSSSSGTYAPRFSAYPSLGLTWLGKGWLPLSNSTLINKFNVRAEYSLTGNSRFSSNFGKYYYTSSPYQNISGIVRANISNTQLRPEKNAQLNLGLDLSILQNRLSLTFDYYNSKTSDVIFAVPQSSAFGTGNYYKNCGEIENHGIEFSMQASVIRTNDIEWIIGGNIASNKNKVKSLGGTNQLIMKFSDGAQIITKVGDSPYQYYGYEVAGVFSTEAQAASANLKNSTGRVFQAGDVHYIDQNKDGKIDDKDRVALGSAAPNYFGGFYTSLRYKSFSIGAEFSYSKGNKAYNAVRRSLESLSTTGNQSVAVLNRWDVEGQVTDMPRAQWGDPLGNNDFSARWIEDASYLRMKNIILSYSFDKKVFNFFRSGTFYVTGENLWTATKYLGMDPEFSYSYEDAAQGFDYAKLMLPKSVKFGINLKF